MNLYEKLASIYGAVQYLAKDDKVTFGSTSYKALSEEKVTSIMHEQMVKHKLLVFPVEMTSSRVGNLSHVDVKYRIVNAEAPDESIEVVSCGDGADTQDKGAGKAMTYAYKYMWLRTFCIPTGEDPDKIASAQLDAEAEAAKQAPAPAAPEEPKQTKVDPGKPLKTCANCGQPVTSYGRKSAEEINKYCEERFGINYCGRCLSQFLKAEKAKEAAQ